MHYGVTVWASHERKGVRALQNIIIILNKMKDSGIMTTARVRVRIPFVREHKR